MGKQVSPVQRGGLLYEALGCSSGDCVGSLCPGRVRPFSISAGGLGGGVLEKTQPGGETAFRLCLSHHLQRKTERVFEAWALGGVRVLSV